MVKVTVEVRSGAARFGVTVRAQSVRRALSLMQGRYPDRDVRVKYLEEAFEEGPAARAGQKLAA